MPRHVESDHPKAVTNLGIFEDMAELSAVRSGRMQTNQRSPLACFFEINAVRPSRDIGMDVLAHCIFETQRHLRNYPRCGQNILEIL